jgi:hypothetical protein
LPRPTIRISDNAHPTRPSKCWRAGSGIGSCCDFGVAVKLES